MPNPKPISDHLKPWHFKRGESPRSNGGRARVFDRAIRTALTPGERMAVIRNIIEIAKGNKGKPGDQVAAARFLIERLDGKDPKQVEHSLKQHGITLVVEPTDNVIDLPSLPIAEVKP